MVAKFKFGLHSKLATIDDLAVSHFDPDGDSFHLEEHHGARLQVGTILVGSLLGKWAAAEHSLKAMHIGEKNEHEFGGFAYIRRVTAITEFVNGFTRIETSPDLGSEKVISHGGFEIDYNNTKLEVIRRRTAAEALKAFYQNPMGFDTEEAQSFFGSDNDFHDGHEKRKLNQGVCDSQCGGPNDARAWYKNRMSSPNELCFYCFEYEKT